MIRLFERNLLANQTFFIQETKEIEAQQTLPRARLLFPPPDGATRVPRRTRHSLGVLQVVGEVEEGRDGGEVGAVGDGPALHVEARLGAHVALERVSEHLLADPALVQTRRLERGLGRRGQEADEDGDRDGDEEEVGAGASSRVDHDVRGGQDYLQMEESEN